MKKIKIILFSTGIITLLITAGCIVPEGGRGGYSHGDRHYRDHVDVIVGPPVIVVRPPEVIVR